MADGAPPYFNFKALVFFDSYLLKLCISFITPVLELLDACLLLERCGPPTRLGPADGVVCIYPIDWRNSLLSVDPNFGNWSELSVFLASLTVFLPFVGGIVIGSMLFANGCEICWSLDKAEELSKLAFLSLDLWCFVVYGLWLFFYLLLKSSMRTTVGYSSMSYEGLSEIESSCKWSNTIS